jgi:uncharacterized SAM-binding protein YcdF (DUF218 family)
MTTSTLFPNERQEARPVVVARSNVFLGHLLRLLAALTGLALFALFAGFVLTLNVGNWLVKEDPLQKADAIAVLSGNFPARAMEAAALYHDGYAGEIWLTHPGNQTDALKEFGIRYPSEDAVNFQILRRQGVPAKAIHVLESPIINTADEIDVISNALTENGDDSVIVVTDKAHTRRVHTLWAKFGAARGTAIVRAVSDDTFNPSAWWKSTEDTHKVVHELMGMVNVWSGLPLCNNLRSKPSTAEVLPQTLQSLPIRKPLAKEPVEQE